jgi:hypothetical protein
MDDINNNKDVDTIDISVINEIIIIFFVLLLLFLDILKIYT